MVIKQRYIEEFIPIEGGDCSIGDYRDHLCTLYTQPDMRFDRWKITELRTRRDKRTRFKHEFLVATFTDGARGTIHLQIQRHIQNASSPLPVADNDEENDLQITQFGMTVLDRVSFYDPEPQGRRTAEHITFSEGHRISLPKFIFLACAVRESSKEHPLRRANSYWFCSAMMGALKAHVPEHISLPVQEGKKLITWNALLCGSVNVDELLARAEQMWSDFEQLRIQVNVN